MERPQFEQWLRMQYPHVTEIQLAQLDQFHTLLLTWNEKINLLSRAEGLDVYEKHFIDSVLFPTPLLTNDASVLDLGSGAGFPGIPLKILHPDLTIYLLEPTQKRARFLSLVVASLGLQKTYVIGERAEAYVTTTRDMFDIVVARAVAPLNILLEIATPLLKVGGSLLAYKGTHADQELVDAANALKVLGLSISNHQRALLPTYGYERHLLTIQKTIPTPSRYPRLYADIKHKPL